VVSSLEAVGKGSIRIAGYERGEALLKIRSRILKKTGEKKETERGKRGARHVGGVRQRR